jgi:hypothetical protein
LRVLHVITGLAPGGAENQLRLLLRHTRHRAQVVTLTNPGAMAATIADEGTPVYHLGMRSNRDITALARLWRFIADHPVDVVHAHLYRSLIYGRLAAFLARMPIVVSTEHSLGAREQLRLRSVGSYANPQLLNDILEPCPRSAQMRAVAGSKT